MSLEDVRIQIGSLHTLEKVQDIEDGQKTPNGCRHIEKLDDGAGCLGACNGCTNSSAKPASSIQEIDPELLRTSLEDRMAYVRDFIMFTAKDQEVLNKVAPLVHDAIPQIVDELYAKLFEFDITKKIFMERNEGFDGPLPQTLEDLSLDSPQLVYRKIFMKAWARRILTSDFSSLKTWSYLDKVGIMHTGVKSFKHRTHAMPLVVPYRDCALTLGWVENVLHTAVLRLPEEQLPMGDKISAVSALSKVIWIQNDLFARHYIEE
ncbi:hypothetical protein Moror_6489 [Moniliophthora roreri MCA 2997]|uniref:Globin-sensor domain-containing protein n=1 Tax=Moniliophthora roreri (strain MCA 2997) TaxID=1381753 RepID=V2XVL1_MONRO|nr:hypothetical protein Moror_6489 [Moniliophthora roreri MCA 2997]